MSAAEGRRRYEATHNRTPAEAAEQPYPTGTGVQRGRLAYLAARGDIKARDALKAHDDRSMSSDDQSSGGDVA